MYVKTIELTIDRIENSIAVAYDENGKEYTFNSNIADIKESEIVSATFSSDGEIVRIMPLDEKTVKIKSALKKRLSNLFGEHERDKK